MNTKRILVIDNEQSIQEVVEINLSMVGGWQVLTASTLSEGFLIAQKELLDLIILDLALLNTHDRRFLKEIDFFPIRSIPIIILFSGTQLLNSRNELSRLNIVYVIPKPFGIGALVNCVAQVLGEPAPPLNSNDIL